MCIRDRLWIDGVPKVLTQLSTTPNNANAKVSDHMRISGVWGASGYLFGGVLDVVRVYTGAITQAPVSYTHLDVYKRQHLYRCSVKRIAEHRSQCDKLLILKGSNHA